MQALTLNQLTKTYDNGFTALKGISLSVAVGDFFALLGPNGAGKTTLMGILSSIVTKSSGDVSVFGKDLDQFPSLVKSYIGVVPQEFNLAIFKNVDQVITYQAGLYGLPYKIAKQQSEKYLKALDLWDKRHLPVRALSGGMKRRLMIARALAHEPKLLILDEPTAGIDIENRRSMWDFLRTINKQGTTIILTTHYLEEAENLCRNIAIIDHGKIIEHSNMRSLLAKLNIETFILYLKHPLTSALQFSQFNCKLIDDTTLEVDVNDQQNMNDLFTALDQLNITVLRMRNKTNRLEEFFLKLVKQPDKHVS